MAERIANWLFMHLVVTVASRRPPDFTVGADSAGGAYLLRWYLTPWRRLQTRLRERATSRPTWYNRAAARLGNCLPNLYLHRFLRDDDARALHDHPSWSASFILFGRYIEHTIDAGGIHRRTEHAAGSLRLLRTRHAHRIELLREPDQGDGTAPPALACWTLFLMGPMVREWGFYHPTRGWIHWKAWVEEFGS